MSRHVWLVLFALSCSRVPPEAARLECRAKALLPLVGDIRAARELAQRPADQLNLKALAAYAGRASSDTYRARVALLACEPAGPDAGAP